MVPSRHRDCGYQVRGRCGVLLANLGTPDAPTPAALRRYLREFLSDRRVVEAPRVLWWLLLNLVILPLRPRRSARLYRKIWTPDGSPLLATSQRLAAAVAELLREQLGRPVPVLLGMRYGRPSIAGALRTLRDQECSALVVLPLYPQYSASTTGSTFDAVAAEIGGWRRVPALDFIDGYHDHPAYIDALAQSVRRVREAGDDENRLLFSFHGIPQRYADAGDPYPEQCAETARLVADRLDLADDGWQLAFQSRFGREPWLMPYTDQTLREWGASGLAAADVICPGFAADCLETLEEIALTGREQFQSAGGGAFRYIPALNDRPEHARVLAGLVADRIG